MHPGKNGNAPVPCSCAAGRMKGGYPFETDYNDFFGSMPFFTAGFSNDSICGGSGKKQGLDGN